MAEGHQVMVFVHARKETVKAAQSLRESSVLEGNTEHFLCEDHPQYSFFRQKIGESRNKEMKQLFDSGFGIHHAGMLRSDRNMMESMFEKKAIKVCLIFNGSILVYRNITWQVLCCTATLAWGVNLPAHAGLSQATDKPIFSFTSSESCDKGDSGLWQCQREICRPFSPWRVTSLWTRRTTWSGK